MSSNLDTYDIEELIDDEVLEASLFRAARRVGRAIGRASLPGGSARFGSRDRSRGVNLPSVGLPSFGGGGRGVRGGAGSLGGSSRVPIRGGEGAGHKGSETDGRAPRPQDYLDTAYRRLYHQRRQAQMDREMGGHFIVTPDGRRIFIVAGTAGSRTPNPRGIALGQSGETRPIGPELARPRALIPTETTPEFRQATQGAIERGRQIAQSGSSQVSVALPGETSLRPDTPEWNAEVARKASAYVSTKVRRKGTNEMVEPTMDDLQKMLYHEFGYDPSNPDKDPLLKSIRSQTPNEEYGQQLRIQALNLAMKDLSSKHSRSVPPRPSNQPSRLPPEKVEQAKAAAKAVSDRRARETAEEVRKAAERQIDFSTRPLLDTSPEGKAKFQKEVEEHIQAGAQIITPLTSLRSVPVPGTKKYDELVTHRADLLLEEDYSQRELREIENALLQSQAGPTTPIERQNLQLDLKAVKQAKARRAALKGAAYSASVPYAAQLPEGDGKEGVPGGDPGSAAVQADFLGNLSLDALDDMITSRRKVWEEMTSSKNPEFPEWAATRLNAAVQAFNARKVARYKHQQVEDRLKKYMEWERNPASTKRNPLPAVQVFNDKALAAFISVEGLRRFEMRTEESSVRATARALGMNDLDVRDIYQVIKADLLGPSQDSIYLDKIHKGVFFLRDNDIHDGILRTGRQLLAAEEEWAAFYSFDDSLQKQLKETDEQFQRRLDRFEKAQLNQQINAKTLQQGMSLAGYTYFEQDFYDRPEGDPPVSGVPGEALPLEEITAKSIYPRLKGIKNRVFEPIQEGERPLEDPDRALAFVALYMLDRRGVPKWRAQSVVASLMGGQPVLDPYFSTKKDPRSTISGKVTFPEYDDIYNHPHFRVDRLRRVLIGEIGTPQERQSLRDAMVKMLVDPDTSPLFNVRRETFKGFNNPDDQRKEIKKRSKQVVSRLRKALIGETIRDLNEPGLRPAGTTPGNLPPMPVQGPSANRPYSERTTEQLRMSANSLRNIYADESLSASARAIARQQSDLINKELATRETPQPRENIGFNPDSLVHDVYFQEVVSNIAQRVRENPERSAKILDGIVDEPVFLFGARDLQNESEVRVAEEIGFHAGQKGLRVRTGATSGTAPFVRGLVAGGGHAEVWIGSEGLRRGFINELEAGLGPRSAWEGSVKFKMIDPHIDSAESEDHDYYAMAKEALGESWDNVTEPARRAVAATAKGMERSGPVILLKRSSKLVDGGSRDRAMFGAAHVAGKLAEMQDKEVRDVRKEMGPVFDTMEALLIEKQIANEKGRMSALARGTRIEDLDPGAEAPPRGEIAPTSALVPETDATLDPPSLPSPPTPDVPDADLPTLEEPTTERAKITGLDAVSRAILQQDIWKGLKEDADSEFGPNRVVGKKILEYLPPELQELAGPDGMKAHSVFSGTFGSDFSSSKKSIIDFSVARTFGIPDGSRGVPTEMPFDSSESAEYGVGVLRAIYTATQKELASRGISELLVYRGVLRKEDKTPQWMRDLPENEAVEQTLHVGPSSSWTLDPTIAANYGRTTGSSTGVIAAARIPASRVIALPSTGIGAASHSEVLVLGGEGSPIQARVLKTPDVSRPIPLAEVGGISGVRTGKEVEAQQLADEMFGDLPENPSGPYSIEGFEPRGMSSGTQTELDPVTDLSDDALLQRIEDLSQVAPSLSGPEGIRAQDELSQYEGEAASRGLSVATPETRAEANQAVLDRYPPENDVSPAPAVGDSAPPVGELPRGEAPTPVTEVDPRSLSALDLEDRIRDLRTRGTFSIEDSTRLGQALDTELLTHPEYKAVLPLIERRANLEAEMEDLEAEWSRLQPRGLFGRGKRAFEAVDRQLLQHRREIQELQRTIQIGKNRALINVLSKYQTFGGQTPLTGMEPDDLATALQPGAPLYGVATPEGVVEGQDALAAVMRFVPTRWRDKIAEAGGVNIFRITEDDPTPTSYVNPAQLRGLGVPDAAGLIVLDPNVGVAGALHEFTHAVEEVDPDLLRRNIDFLFRRVGNAADIPGEIQAQPDGSLRVPVSGLDSYSSKIYVGSGEVGIRATEVLTRGVEALFTGRLDGRTVDLEVDYPEWYEYILGELGGR